MRTGRAAGVLAVTSLMAAAPFARGGAQTGLPAEEQAIVRFVDAHRDEAIRLLERVVNINSGTMNLAGVREVGRVFDAELKALGFQTAWVDGAPFKRAGHLVAEHPGTGPKVLLIGHLDTVFERDSPFQAFERLGADAARGPGIIDMKGGDVVIVQALQALAAIGALKTMDVTVVMTGDEEDPGEPQGAARAALVAAAKGKDVAIGFEDGAMDPKTAIVARRGTTSWTLRVTGKPAHSSQIFREDVGPGAIFEAARILEGFRAALAGERYLTFNPGVVLGGTAAEFDPERARGSAFGKTNVIAEHAVVSGDLRTLSAEQLERTKQAMQAIAGRSLPHTRAALTFDEGYPPLAPTDANRRLLALYDRVSRDLGTGAVVEVDPMKAGAADVSFVAGHVPMILDGIGLMGADDHTVKETADLRTLPSQTKRAAIMLLRLHRGVPQAPPAAVARGTNGTQTPAPARPAITGISHVAFRVSDLAGARRFYHELIGLSERPGQAREGLRFAVGAQQSVQVEPGLKPAEDERLSHVAYATPDVAAMERFLQARGIAVTRTPSACEETAIRVRDPDGHAIEFVQAAWPPPAGPAVAGHALSTRVLHAGLVVRDEAAAHAFYRDVLGFSEIWRGGRPEGVTSWVNMRVPEGTDYLEYMLYAKAPDRRQRGSAHHVCLRVPDIQSAFETTAARGAAIGRQPSSPPSVGVNGKWQLNLFDPDGTRVELMEPFRTR